MQILQGKIKLDKGEKRVGNFVIKNEDAHIKIQDINALFSHRVSKGIAAGQFLMMLYEKFEGDDAIRSTLANYVAFIWSISCCIPDADFLKDAYEITKACMERHPELYGQPRTPQDDAADLEALRAIKEEKDLQAQVAASENERNNATEGK